MHCLKCHQAIILNDNIKTKGGIRIPLDPTTKRFHKCKTAVHKRKGMMRNLTRTQVGYYQVLQIYPGATVEEIEFAFEKLVLETHPDNPDGHGDERWYKKVIEAHNNIRLIRVLDE